jgi:hypothetical protein
MQLVDLDTVWSLGLDTTGLDYCFCTWRKWCCDGQALA